jgi:DNA-binding PadR family transcriptional regulator
MARRRKALNPAAQHIILALLEGELHGYALIGHVDELSGGAVRMGPGTLYGTLNRLVDETTDRVSRAPGERRRYYELTASGRTVALEELDRLRALVQRVSGRSIGGATA